jgi:hypothetical protein
VASQAVHAQGTRGGRRLKSGPWSCKCAVS